MMRSIVLLLILLQSISTLFADTTVGEWKTIKEIDAARIIGEFAFNPKEVKPMKFPDEIPLTTLSGRRGFGARTAWIFLQGNSNIVGDRITFYKESEDIDDSQIIGHYFLTEHNMDLDYNHARASYYRFTDEMLFRVVAKDGFPSKLEFTNSANKRLSIEIKRDHYIYSYEFKNKTYSFKTTKDKEADFLHRLGEILASPIILILCLG